MSRGRLLNVSSSIFDGRLSVVALAVVPAVQGKVKLCVEVVADFSPMK